MIKFFRHIRKSLIIQNNMSKYFKYAIGEILLVVIGILIALQINNWNEHKKLQIEEQKLLKALVKEIESNLENLKLTMAKNDTVLQESTLFLNNVLNGSVPDFDALNILYILGYNVNRIDTSILNEILGTDTRALISD